MNENFSIKNNIQSLEEILVCKKKKKIIPTPKSIPKSSKKEKFIPLQAKQVKW